MMDYNPFKKRISELNKFSPEQGNVLVSEPFMQDDYFQRSVVLILKNNDTGTLGLILNDDLGINLSEVVNEELPFDAPLFLGGPVQTEQLFFLHQYAELTDSKKIRDDVYWGGNFEQLIELIRLKTIEANQVRFFLGYSGWDSNQLSYEIKAESWLIGKIEKKTIFEPTTDHLWKETLSKMGKEQAMLSTFPADPSLN